MKVDDHLNEQAATAVLTSSPFDKITRLNMPSQINQNQKGRRVGKKKDLIGVPHMLNSELLETNIRN